MNTKILNITSSILVLVIIFACGMQNKETIRYVALGDSYTICEGAKQEESWPHILTERLKKNGINIELIANPSKTGWTTQDLIRHLTDELPVFDSSSPAFATLLIGVNDWVQEVSAEKFHSNLNFIIDHVLKKLQATDDGGQTTEVKKPNISHPTSVSRLILITIPDFSVTPEGPKYSKGRNISEGLKEFNKIIMDEAKKRNLKCVDIFPTSLEMKNNSELVAGDGLHPSAKEYALWEKLIYPVVYEVLY